MKLKRAITASLGDDLNGFKPLRRTTADMGNNFNIAPVALFHGDRTVVGADIQSGIGLMVDIIRAGFFENGMAPASFGDLEAGHE
jgi:hypothetical protein